MPEVVHLHSYSSKKKKNVFKLIKLEERKILQPAICSWCVFLLEIEKKKEKKKQYLKLKFTLTVYHLYITDVIFQATSLTVLTCYKL